MTDSHGPLIVIGGHEDKKHSRSILKAVADATAGGKLVIATVASHKPEGYFASYQEGFDGLGVGELVELYLDSREETFDGDKLSILEGAAGVFFSGGDQLRLSSQVGDSPIEKKVRDIWHGGGVIAGTSAGASVMSETMLVRGTSSESHRIGDLRMAAGLGLLRDVVIDQHFAERGRIGRLLGAVAQSPRVLGIGIDEDTAIRVRGQTFDVLGTGAVYVVDGRNVTWSNISEAREEEALSMFGVAMHVLSARDVFNLGTRTPEVSNVQRSEGG